MKVKQKTKKPKSKKKSLFVIAAVICMVGVVGYISKYWLGDDNFIEEKAEQFIEKNTGLTLDLSPSSPESPKRYSWSESTND